MKEVPKVQKYMTPMPHSIGKEMPIKKAYEMMREHRFRHLPVLEGGKIVGVLTDRDVKLASSFKDAYDFKVEEVMTPDPYCVEPDTSILTVATEMAEKKYGCAIIQQKNGKLVGIFTITDGMRAFSEVLGQFYKPGH